MFNELFFRSDALTRQLSAPLVEERRQYLAECASQGMSRRSLRDKSLLLLSIVEHLRLGHRPKDRISLAEIKDAARRWSRRTLPSAKSRYVTESRAFFITLAVGWLTFLNRFQTESKSVTVHDRYMGHARLAATQAYLSMTPNLLHQASLRFERYAIREGGND